MKTTYYKNKEDVIKSFLNYENFLEDKITSIELLSDALKDRKVLQLQMPYTE